MANITIRNLDDEVKRKLRIRAAENGCSMEAEVREILRQAVDQIPNDPVDFARLFRTQFGPENGIEPEPPPNKPMPESTDQRPQYKSDLFQRIRAIVDPVGGFELEIPPRTLGREPPTFE